jgi:Pterin 4 alpha carbinolamine dehydratase
MARERQTTEAWPLHREHPVEYPEDASPLGEDEAQQLDAQVDQAWQRASTRRVSRKFTFGDFRDAFGFAARVPLLAD